jgi:hypothetical protein
MNIPSSAVNYSIRDKLQAMSGCALVVFIPVMLILVPVSLLWLFKKDKDGLDIFICVYGIVGSAILTFFGALLFFEKSKVLDSILHYFN